MNKLKEKNKTKTLYKWCLIIYMVIIIKLIIFKYPLSTMHEIAENWGIHLIRLGIHSANFTPFKTIKMYIHYYGRLNSFENLFGNILIFIPFGILAPLSFRRLRKWYLLLPLSFLFIFGIEFFQLVTRFGEFDVDDILLNMTGVLIGWLCYQIGRRFHKNT